jgi:hypothetical protein
MANGVVTTARFTPYTFDEMMKPLMYLQQKHDTLMAANAEMASKMAVMESFLPKESRAYKELYEPYMQQVQDMATKLSDRGVLDNKGNFSPEMVNSLRDLRIGFSKTFTPLDDALKRYKLRQENDVLVKNKDPKMIGVFGRKEFDDFLDDPTLGTDSYISADQFYQEAAKNFQALARGEFNSPSLKKFSKYYDLFSQTAGMTPDQVIDFITKSKGGQFAQEFLNAMFEDQLATYGYADKLDSNGKNRLYSAFKSAMPYLTGPTQHQLVDNGEKEKEMAYFRASLAQQQQADAGMEAGFRYIKNEGSTGELDEDRIKEAEEMRNGFRTKIEKSDGLFSPLTIQNKFNKDAFLPKKGSRYYDMMMNYYNSNPVGYQKVKDLMAKLDKGQELTKEENKYLQQTIDGSINMEYTMAINNNTGINLTPGGVKNIINNVQYDALKGNTPDGMNAEVFMNRFKNLEDPTVRYDIRKGKIVFEGFNKVDGEGMRKASYSIPIKSLINSKTIDIRYINKNGEPVVENIPIKEFEATIKALAKKKDETSVNRLLALLNQGASQIAGTAHGASNINNVTYNADGSLIDTTQR